ncbi:hypothetical protein PT974_02256 [Cladobotryum mycophilum]|uniref:Uncharacterized protein n=1 Tax=Cladobotryum mycophilum TaxID=491253 RepID=A0ABR0SXU3_9HYPO
MPTDARRRPAEEGHRHASQITLLFRMPDEASSLLLPRVPKKEENPFRRICLGRLAQVKLCEHEALDWSTVESAHARNRIIKLTCKHPSHQPKNASDGGWRHSVFPHARLLPMHYGPETSIHLSWTLPLLDIKSKRPFKLSALQDALKNLPETALFGHTLCRHVNLSSTQLLNAPRSSACECFPQSEPSSQRTTRQKRQEDEQRGKSRTSLKFEYRWAVHRPISPAWLCLLDDDTLASIFDETTRHVLWCEHAGCATSARGRWLRMVKRYTLTREFKYNLDRSHMLGCGRPERYESGCADHFNPERMSARCFIDGSRYKLPPKWALDCLPKMPIDNECLANQLPADIEKRRRSVKGRGYYNY